MHITNVQCCREILFLFNRLFREISRNEDLIAIFISRYIIDVYYQFIISYSLLWWLIMATQNPHLLLQKMNSFVLIAKCLKAVSGNTSDGTRKQSVLAGLFVTFAMDGCQDMGTIPRT